MTDQKISRIWKPIELTKEWLDCDTTILDAITDAWYVKREELQTNSKEFAQFMEQLKRTHAIETGVIERLYDLDRGVTDTLIRKGFIEVALSHEDTDIPVPKLMDHLTDHMEAVDFVFDVVKENRELTVGFINELHALVTRHQETAEGRNPDGTKSQIKLIKGKFKQWENNPSRPDGTKVLYCPPEQVASEMDNLINIYQSSIEASIHPVLLTAWAHHAFTTIHPYQDGNGRVARLMASLILIKHGLFPMTVRREEAKELYISSLEKADAGEPQSLVTYLCETQREHIEDALHLKEESTSTSLDEMAKIFSGKLEVWQSSKQKEKELQEQQRQSQISSARMAAFNLCLESVNLSIQKLEAQFNGSTSFSLRWCSPSGDYSPNVEQVLIGSQDPKEFYYGQIIKYAKWAKYYFNRQLPKGWIMVYIWISEEKKYRLGITIHHRDHDDSTLSIGAFLEDGGRSMEHEERIDATLPVEIRPLAISTQSDVSLKSDLIRKWVEHSFTVVLGHILKDLQS